MALKNNTWKLNQWYDQNVAGNATYSSSMITLYSWGYNNQGNLGLNNTTGQPSVAQVPGTTWAKLGGGGEDSSSAIKSDGTLWTWGKGSYGALGYPNSSHNVAKSSPTQIPGTDWNEVSMHGQGMLAVKTDGTLWAWGQNNNGQLGQNQSTNQLVAISSPVQVGSDTTWSKGLNSGSPTVAVIKTDGTLWMWGGNSRGQLGQNQPEATGQSSPVQVPGTWATGSLAGFWTAGIKTDGTLWSWGYNNAGALGQGNNTNRSSPTQIGAGTDWATSHGSVASRSYGGSAIKTDGTLWCWGYNDSGECGQNTGPGTSTYESPVQVPGTTWRSVFCGRKNTFATKTDGTLWSWGYSNRSSTGLLGQGNTTKYSSPVQIGSDTDWHTIQGGAMFHTFGTKML